MRISKIAASAVLAALAASSGAAAKTFTNSDFRNVAGFTIDTDLARAHALEGIGFMSDNGYTISFSKTGAGGATSRLSLTISKHITVDCGWYDAATRHDAVYTLCTTRGMDNVRALLAGGQDRNSYLALIGGKPKGLSYDFGLSLVTVTMPDPESTPAAVTVAWCFESGC